MENRILRTRREVHDLQKPEKGQEEASKARIGFLTMIESRKRVKIESRLEKNQIKRNGRRSSFGVVIFTG